MAWENVQARKEDGGLGIKDLELQNCCLLMKFINKLFSGESVTWKNWLLQDASSFDTPSSGTHSYLWKIITDELNTYRSITSVTVYNGASTSFWFDHWLHSGPLHLSHAALFSHVTRPNVSVQCVFQNEFDLRLRPRFTNAASAQLDRLLSCLQGIRLRAGNDIRVLKLTGKLNHTRPAMPTEHWTLNMAQRISMAAAFGRPVYQTMSRSSPGCISRTG